MAAGLAGLAVASTACGSSTPTPTAAASRAPIGAVYQSLFDFSAHHTLAQMEADIQGGTALKSALQEGASSSLASGVSGATINSLSIPSSSACSTAKVPAPCAKVNFDIMAGTTAVASGETGYATYSSGKWQVAKVTICSLLDAMYSVEGNSGTPPGCPTSS